MKEEILEPVFRFFRVRTISPFIPDNAVLCDIGCGFDATFLRSVYQRISRGYGFDKKGAVFSHQNLTVARADIESRLPLPDGSVDCVTLLAVLEHLVNAQMAIDECYRIIKTGGVVIITTPAPRSRPILEFLSYRLKIVSPAEIRDHKHYYSKKELYILLNHAGFNRILVKPFEFGLNYLAVGHKGQS